MKTIKYRYDDYGYKSEECLEYIEVIITKYQIKVNFGRDDLFITNIFKYHENLLDSLKVFNIIGNNHNKTYPLDGFKENLVIDGEYIKEELIDSFKEKLNKLLEFDVIEECKRKYRIYIINK